MFSSYSAVWLPRFPELLVSIAIGTAFGLFLVASKESVPTPRSVMDQDQPVSESTSDDETLPDLSATVSYEGENRCRWYRITPPAPVPPTQPKLDSSKTLTRQTSPGPYYRKYVPIPKGQSPNGIRLARSQAPLPVSAKKVDGRYVCAKKHDRGQKSDKNKRGHIDRECCLDPDEVPNPHCTYS